MLYEFKFSDVHVFGYSPADISMVSGWVDLEPMSQDFHYGFTPFTKLSTIQDEIASLNADLIFAVGLSQLIPSELLRQPRLGCVGFHPSALPKGRGRAPIAWMVLEGGAGAATFFQLTEGADDGPIISQEFFNIVDEDDAKSVELKSLAAQRVALNRLLPQLLLDKFKVSQQDEKLASWYGKRAPEDGWINWSDNASNIGRLIRASTAPHPGAYTFYKSVKIIVWAVKLPNECDLAIKGVVGRILSIQDDGTFLIQCGHSTVLRVTKWTAVETWEPKVGDMLGYYAEYEIFKIHCELARLSEVIIQLSNKINL
jgi:methionyl-tRNA formyltransferase